MPRKEKRSHHFIEKFKKLDSFPETVQLRLEGTETEFKSYFGAFLTLVLYGFIMWFTAYKLKKMFTLYDPEVKVRIDEDTFNSEYTFTDTET